MVTEKLSLSPSHITPKQYSKVEKLLSRSTAWVTIFTDSGSLTESDGPKQGTNQIMLLV